MADDRREGDNVVPFRIGLRVDCPRPLEKPPAPLKKLGLFPLGEHDVILSLDLLSAVCALLERGAAEDQKTMARQLRDGYSSPFVGG